MVAAKRADPFAEALIQARQLAALGETLVIDTETGWPRFGGAVELAGAMNAYCLGLEQVLARPIRVREAVA